MDEELKQDWKRIRELSDYSLEHPLDAKQYEEMMGLAEKLNIKGGQIPRMV